MNIFHWHIVDSQSFPLEVPEFPEIAAKGAYSSREMYSVADVQSIVSYASAVRTSFALAPYPLTLYFSAELTF